MKLCKVIRRQFYIENMRKNFQYSLILISCTLIGLQIYLTLFFSKNKVIYRLFIWCHQYYRFWYIRRSRYAVFTPITSRMPPRNNKTMYSIWPRIRWRMQWPCRSCQMNQMAPRSNRHRLSMLHRHCRPFWQWTHNPFTNLTWLFAQLMSRLFVL